MKRTLEKTIHYPHPIDRVWRALTDRDALARWLMPNDFEPVLGHAFQFRTDPAPGWDGVVHCRVLELDAPRLLRISWRGGPIDTVVTWRLTPEAGDRTRLEFQQSGFDGLRAIMVSFILGRGWPGMYERLLPAVLDQLARGLDPDGIPDCGHDHGKSRISDVIARVARHLPGRRADRPADSTTPNDERTPS
jgi:uncharacterized protein YndB with AHSA1/START domain